LVSAQGLVRNHACISSHQISIVMISNHFVTDRLVMLEVVSELEKLLSLSCLWRDKRNACELVGELAIVVVGVYWLMSELVLLLMMYSS
jgi:hypothetical protein